MDRTAWASTLVHCNRCRAAFRSRSATPANGEGRMGLGGGRSASERCLPPTPRPLRSASAPFRAYRRAIGTIFGLPFFATRPLPDVLHLQTPVCKERHVGEGATSVMRVSRKPYLLHVGTRETGPKRSGEAGFSCQTGLHESWTRLCPPRGDPFCLCEEAAAPSRASRKRHHFTAGQTSELPKPSQSARQTPELPKPN